MAALQLLWLWIGLWCLASAVLRHVRKHRHRSAAALYLRVWVTLWGCALAPLALLLVNGMELAVVPQSWLSLAVTAANLRVFIFIGMGAAIAVVALETWRLVLLERDNRPAPLPLQAAVSALALVHRLRPLVVRISAAAGVFPAPCTYGWRRPVIVLPANVSVWLAAERHIVLLHELAHISRADWLRERLARGLRWWLWWLPPAAALYRELRRQAEHAADDWVMAQGVGRVDYATCLLRFAAGNDSRPQAAMALLEPGAVAARAAAILDGSRVRAVERLGNAVFYGALSLSLGLLIGLRLAPLPAAAAAPPRWHIWQLPAPAATAVSVIETPAPDLDKTRFLPATPPALPDANLPLPALAPEPAFEVALHWSTLGARPLLTLAPLAPRYPSAALRRGQGGRVTARFDVAQSGRPTNIEILDSEPAGLFDQSVREAISGARFYRDGRAPWQAQAVELQFKFVPTAH